MTYSSVQINSFKSYPHIQINSFKMRDSEPLSRFSLVSKLTLSGHTLKSTHCFKTYSHVYRITLSKLAFKCTDELFQDLNSSVQINSFKTYPHIRINSFKMRLRAPLLHNSDQHWYLVYIYIISNFRSLKTHRFWHACKRLPQDKQSPCPLF